MCIKIIGGCVQMARYQIAAFVWFVFRVGSSIYAMQINKRVVVMVDQIVIIIWSTV